MQEVGVYNIVFSSSSKVYGVPQYLPLDEKHATGQCTNPYGRTKYMVEQILSDICSANKVKEMSRIMRKPVFGRYIFPIIDGGYSSSRKHLRTNVTPDLHLTYSKNGGNLGSESKR